MRFTQAKHAASHVGVLGVRVSAIDIDDAIGTIESWIAMRERHYVCVSGVHGVMESQRDPELKAIHNAAGLVTPDGMPLVWMAHWSGFRHTKRVYGPDLMRGMTTVAGRKGYRFFLYGATPDVLSRLERNLTAAAPGLQIVGTISPPFRQLTPAEDQKIIDEINASGADIVWVGLSTPKQERWMASHIAELNVPVLVGVGAAFDFLAGVKRQAPGWMQRNGLEWLFRMVSEPRRLAGRYLRNNPAFMMLAAWQLISRRNWSESSPGPSS